MKHASLLILALPVVLLADVYRSHAVPLEPIKPIQFIYTATPNEKSKSDQKLKEEAAVQIIVSTNKEIYKSGEEVEFTVQLRNACSKPLKLEFPSGQNFDISAVLEGQPSSAWRWSTGRMFTQAIRNETLQPGEERVWTAKWDQQVKNTEGKDSIAPRGNYMIDVDVLANGTLVAPPLEIALTE